MSLQIESSKLILIFPKNIKDNSMSYTDLLVLVILFRFNKLYELLPASQRTNQSHRYLLPEGRLNVADHQSPIFTDN